MVIIQSGAFDPALSSFLRLVFVHNAENLRGVLKENNRGNRINSEFFEKFRWRAALGVYCKHCVLMLYYKRKAGILFHFPVKSGDIRAVNLLSEIILAFISHKSRSLQKSTPV